MSKKKKKRLDEAGAAPQHDDFISYGLAWLSGLADDVLMVNRKKDADLEDFTSLDSSAEGLFSEDEDEDEYADDSSTSSLFSEDSDEDEYSDDEDWNSATGKDKSDNDPWPF